MEKITFSKDFIFGVATSAYQIEGSRDNIDTCIWDDFAKIPGKVINFEDGKIACDSYNRIDEDIQIIKKLHFQYYRFSINWTRIFKGSLDNVNQEGINYYLNLIKKLKENGIKPFVTLYHWDLPSYLQAQGGWENDKSPEWFLKYAKVIFEAFKNEVGYYVTINEPFCSATLGYGRGIHAPGIASTASFLKASKNLLLAHGMAVKLYRELNYVGKIGICLNVADIRPINKDVEDKIELIKQKEYYWYLYPLFTKKFPEKAVAYFKNQGYKFNCSNKEMDIISTKCDFIGINHYNPEYYDENLNIVDNNSFHHNSLNWIIDSQSIYNVIHDVYNIAKTDIYILENGTVTYYNDKEKELNDDVRIQYYHDYLLKVKQCISENIPVKGYFAWSLLDNYEWAYGYSQRFGLVYVDYKTLERTIKKSGYYLASIAADIGKKKLIFEDDFQNADNWNLIDSGGGFGNDENQYYLPDNASFTKDGLVIKAMKQKYKNYEYTSSKLVCKKSFMYGHFEFIAKTPKGCGTWPAIWLLSSDIKKVGWPLCGEIDILEEIGRKPNVIHFSLHSKKYNHIINTQKTGFYYVENANNEYHKYSLDWTKDYLSFSINDVEYIRFDKNDKRYDNSLEGWPFDKPYQLIINLAVGGYWGRPIKDEDLPFYFNVKNVKVYKWEDE